MSIMFVVDTGMLQEILKEVKSTQVKFTSKIAQLEQYLKPKSKQRVRPSREIRKHSGLWLLTYGFSIDMKYIDSAMHCIKIFVQPTGDGQKII